MTIQREHRNGPFIAQCDNCRDTYECEGYEFQSALEDAKRSGWQVRKRGETWKHFCGPNCEKDDFNAHHRHHT